MLNPDPERDGIRHLILDAERHGADRTILEAARGTYGDQVRLALPSDPADLHARWQRAAHAAGGTLVDAGAPEKRQTAAPMVLNL